MKRLFFYLFVVGLIFSACDRGVQEQSYSEDEFAILSASLDLPQTVFDYNLELKEHLLSDKNFFPKVNPVSLAEQQTLNNKATLGRVLFYDQNISLDRNVNCGSCHNPALAFSDDKSFSEGVGTTITKRNSLALATTPSFKVAYNTPDKDGNRSKFSWDDAAITLEMQVIMALENENEMNIEEEEIKERIKEKDYYQVLFKKAFGDEEVNSERIADAIAVFVNSISSTQSKFDKGVEGSPGFSVDYDFLNFTPEENRGKKLYNQNCATCHAPKHNFTVKANANNGLQMNYLDKGVGGRLNDPAKYGIFKVPFLRNVEVTGPYMHDGRFNTLEEVVEHYSTGIKNHPNLSQELKDENGNAKRFNFSSDDKDALVSYLKTLTDYSIISNEKFASPFQ